MATARVAAGPSVSDRAAVRVTALPLLTFFALGLLVSVLGSWRPSLWTDEAATISAATRSFPELVQMSAHIDAVHATYYAFMHVWLAVFPATAFWLRLPSGIAVGLATAGTWWLGSRLLSGRAAAGGALAFALLPRTTWMGTEARSYAVSTLLAVAATLVLQEAVSTGRASRRRWPLLVGYGALVAVGVAVNIFLALLLVSHGITLLLLRGVTWRWRWGWLAASVAGLLLAVPIVWRATHQSGQLGAGGFGPASFVRGVVVTQWFLGDTPTPTTGGPGGDLSWATTWKVAAVALALLCWGLVVVALVAGRRRPLLVWTLPWVVAPTLLVGAYSTVVHDVYNPRYFSFAAPAIGLLVGAGLLALPRRWPRVVAAALVLVLLVPVYTSQRTRYAKSSTDWSGVAAFVAEHGHPGEGVYFSPRYPITGPVVGQTARGVRTAYPAAFAGLVDVTQLRTPVQDDNLTGSSRLLADSTATLGTVSAVWVVRRTDYRYAAADDRTLQAAGFAPGQRWQGPLDLVIEYRRS